MIWRYRRQHWDGLPCLIAGTSLTRSEIIYELKQFGHLARLCIVPVSRRKA